MVKYTFRPAEQSESEIQKSEIQKMVELEALTMAEEHKSREVDPLSSNRVEWEASRSDEISDTIKRQKKGMSVAQVCLVPKSEEIIAFCLLDEHNEKLMYLKKLVTHPEFQGKGIGKRFVDMGIESCRANNKNLMVSAFSTSKEFFKKRGFTSKKKLAPFCTEMTMDLYVEGQDLQDLKDAFDWFYKNAEEDV